MNKTFFYLTLHFVSGLLQAQNRYTLFYPMTENDDSSYEWPFNSRYSENKPDHYSYGAVAFSPMVIMKNDTESVTLKTPASYIIDTVYIALSHENNSGKNDTVICKITELDKNNLPGKKVLWSKIVILNKGLSKNNDWRSGNTHLLFQPRLEIKNSKSFAVVLEYFADFRDTLGFRAIYKQDTIHQKVKTIHGYIYPALLPKYSGTNWFRIGANRSAIGSISSVSYPAKGYTPIQHWDIYVRIAETKKE